MKLPTIDFDLLYKVTSPTGDEAIDKFFYLVSRIGTKRFKTVNRLLGVIDFFGSWVQLTDCRDIDDETDNFSLAARSLYRDCEETARGLYREVDALILIAMDRIDYWKDFEGVLAHEVVHLLQNVVFQGSRDFDGHALSIANSAIWPNESLDLAYLNRAKEWAEEEDSNEFEFEAYDWMNYPKMVACLGESLIYKSSVWEESWNCPIDA